MANEEIIMKLSFLEQQSEEIKKHLENIEEQIAELEKLKNCLGKIGKEKEMLTNLGKGIFLKTVAKDDKVFMNVGSKTFVRKSFSEASEIIDGQIVGVSEVKKELMNNLNLLNSELQKLVDEAQKESEKE